MIPGKKENSAPDGRSPGAGKHIAPGGIPASAAGILAFAGFAGNKLRGQNRGSSSIRGRLHGRGEKMHTRIIAVLAAGALAAACTTDPYTGQQKVSNAAIGTGIGAGLGALAGMAVGGSPRSQRNAVLIGA